MTEYVKIFFKYIWSGGVECIHLIRDGELWWALICSKLKLTFGVHKMSGMSENFEQLFAYQGILCSVESVNNQNKIFRNFLINANIKYVYTNLCKQIIEGITLVHKLITVTQPQLSRILP
jgi:hypothetical protein